MKTLLIIGAVLLAGCQPNWKPMVRVYIPDSSQPKAAEFIRATVASSSTRNHGDASDEIDALRNAVSDVYGVSTVGIWDCHSGEFIPYDHCTPEQKRVCDEYLLNP